MIVLTLYLNIQSRQQIEQSLTQQLTLVTQIAAVEHLQIVEGARQLLIAMTSAPEIYSSKTCSAYLADLLKKFRRYSNFGIADLAGNIYCSAIPINDPANIFDKYFFQTTIHSNEFTIGQFAIGQITKRATIYFGYPIHDRKKNITAIAYASLDLSWLTELLQDLSLDPAIRLWVLDRNASVLASSSNSDHAVGSAYPHLEIDKIHEKARGKFFDNDEKEYVLYAIKNIGSDESGPYVILEIPENIASTQAKKTANVYLFLSVTALLLSLGLGLKIGTTFITNITHTFGKIDELKHDFVSLASHQIRTPLTAIRWNAELLLSLKPGLQQKQKEIVRDIQLSSSRIISLVAILLDTSKLESGTMHLTTTACFLSDLVQEVITELPKKRGVTYPRISVVIPNHLPKILIDVKLLKQVYANLIQNAIQYSSPRSTIIIKIVKKQNALVSSIIDQGIGVPKEDRPNLFDKFFRAKNTKSQSYTGSGLGLYLSKLIVEGHGGKLWYKERKKGSIFAFLLPLV
jgi:signal transduction histidine kinase